MKGENDIHGYSFTSSGQDIYLFTHWINQINIHVWQGSFLFSVPEEKWGLWSISEDSSQSWETRPHHVYTPWPFHYFTKASWPSLSEPVGLPENSSFFPDRASPDRCSISRTPSPVLKSKPAKTHEWPLPLGDDVMCCGDACYHLPRKAEDGVDSPGASGPSFLRPPSLLWQMATVWKPVCEKVSGVLASPAVDPQLCN